MPIRSSDVADAYDVVVIGGGLAGLTGANVLAGDGLDVLLAERHFQLGGLASYFKRKRHVFDVALHGFPVGMRKTFRKYWSKEMADRVVQVPSIRFVNPQFELDTVFTEEDFTRILVERFGQPAEAVRAFYAELAGMNFYDDDPRLNRDLFERHFPGRGDITRLLMEPITYANGSTLDEPAITYGIVFSNFMSKGVYTFLGGTDLMLELMVERLEANGAHIALAAPVERVEVVDGRVAAAWVSGRRVACKAVLSNGNLLATINELAGPHCFQPEFLAAARKVRMNTSSCQVYMGLAPGQGFEHVGDLLFTSTCPVFDPERLLDMEPSSRTYSVYYPAIRPDKDPDFTVVASMNARFEDWARLPPAEYQEAKARLAASTVADLGRFIPGIAAKLDHVEVATPLTFRRYTSHLAGSSFGTKFEGLRVSMALPEQVGGLFHAGSVGIIMSGWLGAANYGVIVANNIEKYLSSLP